MNAFMSRLMPRDLVAVFMIGSGVFLKCNGYNGIVDMILVGIAGAYFGAELFINRPRN